MPEIWKSVFFELPENNQVVWVRVLSIYGEPVLSTYKSNGKIFTTDTTGIVIEAIQVARWKPE